MNLSNNTLLQGGKYKIIRFISAGGFGCTYEAEHVMLHKRIAIKEFFVKDFCNRDETTSHVTVGTQSKVALVEKLKRKFIDEAVALSQLSHPNIVTVSDVFIENGTAYYVMDYIEGKSLHLLVNERGALPETEATAYIKEVAEALGYVHKLNRLHLDIKPGNIMVNVDGHAKLIDFGASKQYDEVDGENTSTLLGKTPGYAPIEQMGNRVQTFSAATDIYALGATLYKLVTGETPADATEIADDEEALKPIPNSISSAVRKTIAKSMEVRRKDRQQNIEEFMAGLSSSTSSTPKREIQIEQNGSYLNEEQKQDINEVVEVEENEEDETTMFVSEYMGTSLDDCIAVDLGLSVKWANCNIGSKQPIDVGGYYGWADISGYKIEADSTLYPNDNPPENICANIQYDLAKVILGGHWRLPSKQEQDELRLRCDWKWTEHGKVCGYEITGPNGRNIFLPACGFRIERNIRQQEIAGYYWSGNLHKFNPEDAYYLYFDEKGSKWLNSRRYYGFSIRPVCD